MYRDEAPEVNLEQVLKRIRSFFKRFGLGGVGGGGGVLYFVYGALLVALVIWLATGFYRVEAGEQGVVRQFGEFNSLAPPGLNWRLPSPITSLVKVNTERIRSTEVGFRSNERGLITRDLDESLMLTTDNSIVEAQLNIQYRVEDPKAWVFNVKDPEQVLHTAAEVALRSIIGRTDLITALTGRAEVERDTRAFLTQLLDTYRTGIQLTEVKLQTVDPPDEVKDAFQEVTRALEDETRLENEALAYRADQIPRAQGQIQVVVQGAAGFHREQIEQARGEGNRFLALLGEYRGAPQVTRERLYLETLEDVLSTVDKTLIDSQVSVLPLLDLSGVSRLTGGP
jgi:membrane protease subunit HflK